MKTINPLLGHKLAKAMKPRNTVLAALKAKRGGGAGVHVKSRGALRRAERMALVRQVNDRDWE